MMRITVLLGLAVFQHASAADLNHLQPILAKPGQVVLDMDFETDFVVDKSHKFFVCGQGTTWKAKQGMLVGTESSPEYQAKKEAQGNGHLGTAPRLQIRDSPRDVILRYSFKIVGGKGTKLLPMIEAGHHLRRIYFGADGSQILVDHEKKTIAESDFVLQQDQWYHVMIEIKGDEFLVRFQDGPTIYGNDPGVGADFANHAIGITATDKGTIYIDNLAIWNAADVQPGWVTAKAKFAP
ncbi:hypothetical protein Poly51_13360 [Rubripirellula tenax]|uniref:3-keto-disaccharide hydrolase domain-containing protein n=1 Tax=Rubripirellula tenax TaxID=2528015 RepID=A0A5C6FD21_9BACT|nr:hypothetical protein [Rubripirellula tenax]TWU58557.1 hypothetical protein Poly51_13360 [Rubripirellula tenax]